MVYINPIESTKAIIQEGPVLGDYPIELLTSDNLDEIKHSWEYRLINEYIDEVGAKQINARDALEKINNFIKPSDRATAMRLLDFGCFCGVFLSEAQKFGWECYGIEPLVMPAIYARGKYKLQVVTDTLRSDSFPEEFFDVITSFQVFEHLTYPDQEIKKIRRMLKRNGVLVIEVPNIDTFMLRIMGKRHRHFVQDHVSLFSRHTLARILEQNGFLIRGIYYPSRKMSVGHLHRWVNRTSNLPVLRDKKLPEWLSRISLSVNIRDIVAVIASKCD